MTSTPVPYQPATEHGETFYNAAYTVKSWLLTKDHKRIAILYMLSVTFFFFIGGLKPGVTVAQAEADLIAGFRPLPIPLAGVMLQLPLSRLAASPAL